MHIINDVYAGPLYTAPSLDTIASNALDVLLGIAGSLAVLMIVIAGVMYIVSGGDSDRVALAKKTLIGGVIGIVIVILSLIIVKSIIALV